MVFNFFYDLIFIFDENFIFFFSRDYLQRERTKYKELLANAQNDLNNTKSLIEKEAEMKSKQENTYQVMIEEKGKLISA